MRQIPVCRKEWIYYVLASLCLAAGVLALTVYTAVRFTGFLLCAAAGVLTVLGLLSRLSKTHPWARWARRIALGLLAAGFALFAALEVRVLSWARTDAGTPASAIVVLGAGVNGTTPSLSLETRLDAALAYALDHPEVPIVVSGSQGPGEEISEAACMYGWLAARGVPPERILLEDRARDTEENIRYSLALLEERGIAGSVAVVTSGYHLCRAALHMERMGGSMVPVAAPMPAQYLPLSVNYYIREAFAMAAELLLPNQ